MKEALDLLTALQANQQSQSIAELDRRTNAAANLILRQNQQVEDLAAAVNGHAERIDALGRELAHQAFMQDVYFWVMIGLVLALSLAAIVLFWYNGNRVERRLRALETADKVHQEV